MKKNNVIKYIPMTTHYRDYTIKADVLFAYGPRHIEIDDYTNLSVSLMDRQGNIVQVIPDSIPRNILDMALEDFCEDHESWLVATEQADEESRWEEYKECREHGTY